MSRQFNGTTQSLSAAIDLSAYSTLSIAFWMWWDTFANNDKVAFEFGGASYTNQGFVVDPNASNGGRAKFNFGIGTTTGSPGSWHDDFTRPSAAVWHHYVLTLDRATPGHAAFVDGVTPAGYTTLQHDVRTYGNFSNSTLSFMSRNHASLWGAGRMAEVALWGGVLLTAREALALSSGASPMRIGPVPRFYWPLFGGSPEPDHGGTQKGATLTATPTIVAHPPVRSFLVAA